MFKAIVCGLMLAGLSLVVSAQDIPRAMNTIPFPPDSLVRFSPDVSQMMVIEPGNTIHFYEPDSGEVLLTTPFDSEVRVKFVRWKDDNSAMLFASQHTIYRMNTHTGESEIMVEFPDAKEVIGAAFYQEDTIVARVATAAPPSFFTDFETYVWDANTLEQTLFIPVGDDCLLQTYDDPTEAEVVSFMRNSPGFTGYCGSYYEWSPDQSRYLTWYFWNNASARPMGVYDTASRELLFELSHCPSYDNEDGVCEQTADLEDVRWSPDGTKIVSLPLNGRDGVKVWDAQTGTLLHTLMPIGDDGSIREVRGVRWHTGKQIAAWEDYSGNVFVWDADTGDLTFLWPHADYLPYGLQWIQNDKLTALWGVGSPSNRSVGEVWNAATGEKVAVIATERYSIDTIVDDPERGLLYIVFGDHMDVWDMNHLSGVWGLEE